MTDKQFYTKVIAQCKYAISWQNKHSFICWRLDPGYGTVKTRRRELYKIIRKIVGCEGVYMPNLPEGTERFKQVRIKLLNNIIKHCESKLGKNA